MADKCLRYPWDTWDIPEILWYAWVMPDICLIYAWDTPDIYVRYIRDLPHMHKIHPRYAWDMPEVCLRYAWGMGEIYLRYAWDIPEICMLDMYMRYGWDMVEIWLSRDWSSAYLWTLTGLWAYIGLTNLKNWKKNLEKLENWYNDTDYLEKIRIVLFIWVKQPIQNY